MRKMYIAYLTYPDELDKRIRNIYSLISEKWSNKRTFEFLPMIPLWKVYADDTKEPELLKNVMALAPSSTLEVTISGLTAKTETGYVFITFDPASSKLLREYSEKIRTGMQIHGSEDNMPYGYEPHTSLIKQDSSEIELILTSITDKMEGVQFMPRSIVLSRVTNLDSQTTFEKLFEYSFQQQSSK